MAVDLIDRQAALDALEWKWAGKAAIDAIKELPSAERRGKWEFIGGYGYQYRCSACITCAEHKTRFCPNCGAKMMEGEADE